MLTTKSTSPRAKKRDPMLASTSAASEPLSAAPLSVTRLVPLPARSLKRGNVKLDDGGGEDDDAAIGGGGGATRPKRRRNRSSSSSPPPEGAFLRCLFRGHPLRKGYRL